MNRRQFCVKALISSGPVFAAWPRNMPGIRREQGGTL